MPTALSPHFADLVYDALLKSYWRKNALRRFLRRSGVPSTLLAQLSNDESKRDWLDNLFPALESSERGRILMQQMARSLADQAVFPDLENWEDSEEKIRSAKKAVAALRGYLDRKHEEQENEKAAAQIRQLAAEERATSVRSQAELLKLKCRLDELCTQLGTPEGGYAFQTWFYDLMDYCEVDNRRPYVSEGRQIDGSVTVDGTTYLVELKFTAAQSDATAIDSLLKKVNDKADNTMGLLLSMSGFSSVAIKEASFSKSPLLLFDYGHLYMVLGGIMSYPDLLRRVRRHSSQEGKAYLPADDFGGK